MPTETKTTASKPTATKTRATKPTATKTTAKAAEAAKDDPAVASDKANTKLEHSEGGSTTRDAGDVGVPMLQGDPSEPQGPEDALGPGPKRGDYTNRIGGPEYHPHEGTTPQRPRAEEIGEEKGKKGGVETA